MTVESKKNPNWTRDEHILALDYYLQNRRDYFSPQSEGVLQLARDVSAVAKALGLTGSDTFRNPAGVSMKLLNLRSHDPEFDTKGLPRGNKLEKTLWTEFGDDPERLSKIATNIKVAAIQEGLLPPVEDEENREAAEGRILTRLHSYRERDSKIVRRKKESHLRKHGSIDCEACGFNFENRYGERGTNFIECHHTRPISEMELGEKTKLADLILLCANCHRMIHAKRPWWGLLQLKNALQK